MTHETTAQRPDAFDVFVAFEPMSQKAINWAYACFCWLFLRMAGALAYKLKLGYAKQYPPTTFINALVVHSPLITDLILLVLIFAFATGFRTLRVNRTLRWYGDSPITLNLFGRTLKPRLVTQVVFFLLIGVALCLLLRTLATIIGGPTTSYEEEYTNAPMAFRAFMLTAVAFAPLVEELIYRGVLFIQAYGPVRTLVSVFISTALFTYVHLDQYSSKAGEIHWGAITFVCALGLSCGITRAVTNRVWPAFVIHTSVNACAASAAFLAS